MQIWTSKILKGWRITIPAKVRKIWKLKAGDKILWEVISPGVCKIAPLKQNYRGEHFELLAIFPKSL